MSLLQLDIVTTPSSAETGKLGLWLFLLSEIMLFGGFIAGYATIRWGSSVCALGSPAWPAAGYTGGLALACLNTALLVTSSFTVYRALIFARANDTRFRKNLLATFVLGIGFLAIKGIEYSMKIHHGYYPGSEWLQSNPGLTIFFSFYYALTGLHALHVIAGILWMGFLYSASKAPAVSSGFSSKLEYAGLYWHFVDIIWVFLFPLFYLI